MNGPANTLASPTPAGGGALRKRGAFARSARTLACAGLLASPFLAGCSGQGGEDSAAASSPATKADLTPGVDIPTAKVDFSMAPFADDTIAAIGTKLGYFKDNGIQIGPEANGAKLALTANVAPLISGQVDAGSAVFEVLLSKLDTVDNVRTFVVHGSFEGFALFAPIGSDAKSVKELEAEGKPFDVALKEAIGQFKGDTLAFSNDPSIQLFYSLLFDVAGVKEADFDVSRVANAQVVNLALAGRAELAAPSGGPQVERLASSGLKEIVNEQQILAASTDERRLALVNHSTYVTTKKFYDENYNTVLRMAGAVYRSLDLIRKDPQAAAAAQLPYLNAYAGSKTTPKQLAFLHETITHERTFDEMADYFTRDNAFNVYTSGAAQIAELRKKQVLRKPHEVDELDGAKQVYLDMLDLKNRSAKLLKEKATGDPAVLKVARERYEQRNYLDAYRALATL
ncbi:MAG: hypothetical protein J7513_11845 [Solirubrobacteraceae bacterium]|nr:hypothetical protein [Solirubrobacteraceae bacterium]